MRRTDMLKAREILRLKHEMGLSLREIGKACNCGKTTVSEVLKRAADAQITWPIELSDKQLMSLLYPPVKNHNSPPEPDLEYIYSEMKKKGVTLMLLWEEYKERHPDGIMYTQFCERYRKFKKENQLTIHKEHKGGEEVETDWAGDTMSYVNPETGKVVPVYIFVAVLPASSYPFAYAYENMKKENWIDAHIRAYEFFGGVPRITIPDNTKTAVTKADIVEPILNRSYYEMARHYGTTIIPARPGKPKDKAAGKNMVGNIGRRIIAALRNRQFFSLYEINEAISEYLEKFIDKPFQKIKGNRRSAFEKIDKPYLKPLPAERYEYAEWKEARIGFNYHVEYDGFFYSTPYSYAGRICSVRATARTIEIFVDNERIAAHIRNYDTYRRYTTLEEHMPDEHKAVYGWNSDRFMLWAYKTGPQTRDLVKKILDSEEYPVQSYRTCMGIMRLCKDYPLEIMEAASKAALERNIVSFKYFKIFVKQIASSLPNKNGEKIIKHENIRGRQAYAGGGISV